MRLHELGDGVSSADRCGGMRYIVWAALWLLAELVMAAPPTITLDHGRLSVALRDAPLAEVMTDIAARSGVPLHMENPTALPNITASFADVPFDVGVARLLEAAPGSLVLRDRKGGYAGVSRLYVIASHGSPVAPPAAPAPSARIRRAVIEHMERAGAPAQGGDLQMSNGKLLEGLLPELGSQGLQGRPPGAHDGRPP